MGVGGVGGLGVRQVEGEVLGCQRGRAGEGKGLTWMGVMRGKENIVMFQ